MLINIPSALFGGTLTTQQLGPQKSVFPWLRKCFPKCQSEQVYTHNSNEFYFFNLSNLHILYVIVSTIKMVSIGRERRQLNETRRVFTTCTWKYFSSTWLTFMAVLSNVQWELVTMKVQKLYCEKVFYFFKWFFFSKHSMGWSHFYLKCHSVPIFF